MRKHLFVAKAEKRKAEYNKNMLAYNKRLVCGVTSKVLPRRSWCLCIPITLVLDQRGTHLTFLFRRIHIGNGAVWYIFHITP